MDRLKLCLLGFSAASLLDIVQTAYRVASLSRCKLETCPGVCLVLSRASGKFSETVNCGALAPLRRPAESGVHGPWSKWSLVSFPEKAVGKYRLTANVVLLCCCLQNASCFLLYFSFFPQAKQLRKLDHPVARPTSNSQSSFCLCPLGIRIIGISYHTSKLPYFLRRV